MISCTIHLADKAASELRWRQRVRRAALGAALASSLVAGRAAALDGLPPAPEPSAAVAEVVTVVVRTPPAPATTRRVANAAAEGEGGRDNSEFKAVTSGGETYRGGTLLTVAYMLFFVLMFAWMAAVWRSQARAERQAIALDLRLDAAARTAATGVRAPATTSSE